MYSILFFHFSHSNDFIARYSNKAKHIDTWAQMPMDTLSGVWARTLPCHPGVRSSKEGAGQRGATVQPRGMSGKGAAWHNSGTWTTQARGTSGFQSPGSCPMAHPSPLDKIPVWSARNVSISGIFPMPTPRLPNSWGLCYHSYDSAKNLLDCLFWNDHQNN